MKITTSFWIVGMIIALLIFVIVPHYSSGETPENRTGKQGKSIEFDAMPPENLIQLWDKATRVEESMIVDALLEQKSASLLILRNIVNTGSQRQKLLACALLAEMKDKGAVQPLLLALSDEDEKVRLSAALSLGKIGDVEAIVPLRKMLKENPLSKSLIKSITVSLGRLGSTEDIPTIRSYLSHPDESVRVNAAVALAILGNTEGQKILLQSSRSSIPGAQKEAIYSLGYLNTPESRSRLLEIINDPKGDWKSYAYIALANQDISDKTSEERLEYLSNIVEHSNERLAEWAIERLGEIDNPEAQALLESLSIGRGEIGYYAKRQLNLKK